VNQPDQHRELGNDLIGLGRRRRQQAHAAAHVVQLRHALARSDHQVVQRPPLPGGRVLDEPGAIRRGLRQGLEVAGDLVRRGNRVAGLVADGRFQRRDGRVVAAAGHDLRGGARAQGEEECGGREFHRFFESSQKRPEL
jgi:hypothetical protein